MPKTVGAGPGRCVHCLQEVQHRNYDHVLPASWYPDTTPPNLERWKVPSCIPCNEEHGKNEQWLLITLGLCLPPDDPAAAGIADKALRSINPNLGRTPKEANYRLRLRNRLIRKLKQYKEPPTQGVFPNFGAHATDQDGYLGIEFDANGVRKITEKIVRGIVYLDHGFYIDEGYEFTISFLDNEPARRFTEVAKNSGKLMHRGPGVSIIRAQLPADPRAGIYAIEIWQRCKLYACVAPKNLHDTWREEFER